MCNCKLKCTFSAVATSKSIRGVADQSQANCKYESSISNISIDIFVSETSRPYFINKKVYSEDSGKRIANQNVINQMERSTGMDYFLTA